MYELGIAHVLGIVLSIDTNTPSFFASLDILCAMDNMPSICGEEISSGLRASYIYKLQFE
jgi:hypothetical protein